MSMPDLAPGAPSRVVDIDVTVLTEDAPMSGWVRFSIAGDLRVPGSGKIIGASSRTVQLAGGKGQIRLPTVSSAVVDDAGDAWVIIVQKSWLSQPYGIRVPAGTTAINLADLPPARPLTSRETSWVLTGASVDVQTLPADQPAGGSVALEGGTLRFDLRIPKGEQGLPGPGATAADDAVAAYIATSTSKTAGALDTTYRRGYSPREFGVTGDGSTDDTAAWRDALASVPAGATLTCPEGDRYKITGELTLSKAVTIQGGDFLANPDGATLMIDASDVTLDSVTITGPGAGSSPFDSEKMVQTTGTAEKPIRNLRIRGMRATGSRHSMLWLSWIRDFVIADSYFGGFQYAAVMLLSPKNGRVTGCRVATGVQSVPLVNSYGVSATDLTNDEAGRAENVVISGNQITDIPHWEGIDTHGGRGIIVTDNTVVGCRTPVAITCGNTSRLVAPRDCVVQGNVLVKGNAASETAGVVFDGSKSSTNDLATGMIGVNTVVGYEKDLIVARYDPSRTVILPQAGDALERRGPDAAPFRSWHAKSTIATDTIGAGETNITFPAGKFTAPPIVHVSKQESGGARGVPYAKDITTTGCKIGLFDPTSTSASSRSVAVAIFAVQAQMTGTGTPSA